MVQNYKNLETKLIIYKYLYLQLIWNFACMSISLAHTKAMGDTRPRRSPPWEKKLGWAQGEDNTSLAPARRSLHHRLATRGPSGCLDLSLPYSTRRASLLFPVLYQLHHPGEATAAHISGGWQRTPLGDSGVGTELSEVATGKWEAMSRHEKDEDWEGGGTVRLRRRRRRGWVACASFLDHAKAAAKNRWLVWVLCWRGFWCGTIVFETPF
jgi:hypothetical protein